MVEMMMRRMIIVAVLFVTLPLFAEKVSSLPAGAAAESVLDANDPIARRKVDWDGVPNARDLGGLPGRGGRIVKTGLIYRLSGFNERAHCRVPGSKDKLLPKSEWKGPGRMRIKPSAQKYVVETLGIKTDLDLRSDEETFGMTGSPLGDKVNWVHIPSKQYKSIGGGQGRASFVQHFRIFLNETNYPVAFHCNVGADRTGTLACVLNGLLGVDENILHRDWQYTWTGRSKPTVAPEERWDGLMSVFAAYPGETLNERIEGYVLSCGFTRDEIDRFRAIMLGFCGDKAQ